MNKKNFIPLFLFTFASIVYAYSFSSVTASPNEIIRPLIVLWGLLAICVFLLRWLIKDSELISISLSAFAVIFFSPQDFFLNEIVIIGLLFLFFLIYLSIVKRSLKSSHITNILILSSALSIAWAFKVISPRLFGLSLFDIPYQNWKTREMPDELIAKENSPDIYYIILDGYAREDILNEYYQYDNSQFISNMRAKGFIIPDNARTNYPRTIMSLSSTLNMNYLSDIAPQMNNSQTRLWWLFKPFVDDSDVRRMLETAGYTSYSITTGWGLTDNPSADVYYQPFPIILRDYEWGLLSTTPLRLATPLLSHFAYVPSYTAHRNLFSYNFSALSEISKLKGPKFVVAHIVSPHAPFVFDENGQAITPNYPYSFTDASDLNISDEEYRIGYTQQLSFLNKNLELVAEDILKNSKVAPIIIMQADHGPGMFTNLGSYDNTCLKERFSIFAAYYLPETDRNFIPHDITPVNIFRIVFDQYFETNFELLPNYHYVNNTKSQLFLTKDVTSLVDTCSISQ